MTDPVIESVSIRERVQRIRDECDGVWAQFGVTSWERTFLTDIEHRRALTARQEETVSEIERKAFG